MSILISVNQPYAGWLVDGIKEIEWRKKPLPLGKAFIYETKKGGGSGMVIGEVEIVRAYCVTASTASDDLIRKGKVSRDYLEEYSGIEPVRANRVINAVRYKEPRPLSNFCKIFRKPVPLERPPQSWMYVEEVEQ